MSSCAATVHPDVPATPVCQKRSGSTNAAHPGTLRYGQAPSGALGYSLKRSASMLVQPSSSAMTATTVSRAMDTLCCFNGLQQPQRPHRPKEPEEPQRPQGWMLSFDSPPPIPQLSVKNQNFWLFTFSHGCQSKLSTMSLQSPLRECKYSDNLNT